MLLEPQSTKYDLKWRMLGIPVRIHPLFWLTTLLLGWERNIQFAALAIWMACVLVSILVHEFGHALTAKRFGAQNLRVVLYGLGGLAINDGGLNRRQFIIQVLMGPGAGFILGGLVKLLTLSVPAAFESEHAELAARHLIQINLLWGLVNLLPIFPLDGGQIARELYLARDPHGGIAASLRLSFRVALAMAGGMALLFVLPALEIHPPAWFPLGPSLFNIVFFICLALMSRQLSRPEYLYAEEERREENVRQPWEQDPDWWKKGRG